MARRACASASSRKGDSLPVKHGDFRRRKRTASQDRRHHLRWLWPHSAAPVAMGYVETAFAKPETPVTLVVRGKELPARIAAMPFAPHRYFR